MSWGQVHSGLPNKRIELPTTNTSTHPTKSEFVPQSHIAPPLCARFSPPQRNKNPRGAVVTTVMHATIPTTQWRTWQCTHYQQALQKCVAPLARRDRFNRDCRCTFPFPQEPVGQLHQIMSAGFKHLPPCCHGGPRCPPPQGAAGLLGRLKSQQKVPQNCSSMAPEQQ